MRVNGREIVGQSVAYEGCHKIYICENDADEEKMKGYGYEIYPLKYLPEIWESSCSLRFIDNASLNANYVRQFEEAVFDGGVGDEFGAGFLFDFV